MWAKQLRDKKIRLNYRKKEFKNLAFLFLVNNINVDSTHRLFLNKKFLNKNKNFFKSQIKSRCVESFRSRSPLRDFHLSRVVFRMSASRGALLGIKKSSW